jgi:hypothetical protein
MSDQNAASPAEQAPIEYQPPASSQEAISLDDAVRMLSDPPKDNASEAPEKAAEKPTESTSQEDDAAQPDKAATSETQEDAPAKEPSRDPPRSWSKDKAEYWSKLDPAVQDYLLEQDSKVSAEVRRAQNDAAEVRKTIEAEKKAIEVERERYLKAASSDIESKEADIARRFPHIKTMDDVNFLASEALRLANTGNPEDLTSSQQVQAYLAAWRTAQDDLAVTKANKIETERRDSTEKQSKWNEYVQAESKAFNESLTSADQSKLKGWLEEAPEFLKAKGFSQEELVDLASGKAKLAIHDRRVQALILDGLKYRDLQKAPPKVVPKDLPPVQRPGAKQPTGAAAAQSIQALNNRLTASGSLDDAMELLRAQRQAS